MDREKMIDYLVANGWNEADDRETLEGMSDDKLRQLGSNAVVANAATTGCRVGGKAVWFDTDDGQWKAQVVNAADDEDEDTSVVDDDEADEEETEEEDVEVDEPVAANTAKPMKSVKSAKQLTTNQWLASAPAEVRSAVENAMVIEREAKAQVCQQLVANLAPAKQRIRFNELMHNSLKDLKERLADRGDVTPQKQDAPTDHYALFFGAAGGVNNVANNEQREVLDLESARQNYDPMIVNKKKAQ